MAKNIIIALSISMFLAIIFGLYIYAGMYTASNSSVIETEIELAITSEEEMRSDMSQFQRLQSVGAMSAEHRQDMLDRLNVAN